MAASEGDGATAARAHAAPRQLGEFRLLVDEFERSLILAALANAGGNQKRAAAALGLLPTTLNEKIKRLAIRRRAEAVATGGERWPEEGQAAQKKDFRWRGQLSPGQRLELWGLDGRILVEPALGANARVSATWRDGGEAPYTVAIRAVEHAQGVLVRVHYAMRCEARGVDLASPAGQTRVDYHVLVPPGVHFAARALRAEVEIRGLDGELDIHTARGAVRFLRPVAPPLHSGMQMR